MKTDVESWIRKAENHTVYTKLVLIGREKVQTVSYERENKPVTLVSLHAVGEI